MRAIPGAMVVVAAIALAVTRAFAIPARIAAGVRGRGHVGVPASVAIR
jgi:hypothetical protein